MKYMMNNEDYVNIRRGIESAAFSNRSGMSEFNDQLRSIRERRERRRIHLIGISGVLLLAGILIWSLTF